MKCTNCGAELFPEDKLCGECGAPRASSTRPITPPERTPAPQKTALRPPRQMDVPDVPAAITSRASPDSREGKRRRRLLLPVLVLLAMGLLIVVGGAVAVALGVLRIDELLPYGAAETQIVPQGQVSAESFQAAAKECQPIAGVAPIHEGVDMDVLVRVEGRVGENCGIYQEVIRDGTGRGMTGKSMTCLLPMEVLITGRAPDAPLEDYCSGSLVDAIERQAQEEE